MRLLFVLVLFLCFSHLNAQEKERNEVQATIERFFEGFHQQDSVLIKSTLYKDVIMQTIAKDSLENGVIKQEKIINFLKSITSIPKTTKFEEKILSYHIQIDGDMANAWTNYEFWRNGTFSHCGVNSFQLIKHKEEWKIIYIIDTRRKEDCKP
jgi:hypothetical protein